MSLDWDTILPVRVDSSFDLSAIITARSKANYPPDGVVDHPPLDGPDAEPPYSSPFGSPLSSVPPTDLSSSPLTSLPSSLSSSPSEPAHPPLPTVIATTSCPRVIDLEAGRDSEEEIKQEEGKGKKRRRRRSKKGKKTDSPSSLPFVSMSVPASAAPSVSPSPHRSTSTSPVPSTSSVPPVISVISGTQVPNAETRRKHKVREAKRRRLKDRATTSLGSKNLKSATAIGTAFDAQVMHNQTDGYLGHPGHVPDGDGLVYTLDQLVGSNSRYKFTLQSIPPNATSIPLLDKNDTVIGLLVGPPRGDNSWDTVVANAAESLEAARADLYFEDKRLIHKRGYFPVQPYGVSFGGGQLHPKRIYQPPRNEEILSTLTEKPCFKRLAGHASGAFATWAPKLYRHYFDYDTRLRKEHPFCTKNFENSIWSCATYNFGPSTVTVQHIDHLNYIFGWCAITSLGKFDHTKGGHLVLWELGLVLEFPPGWTALIPSAYIRHSNTPISDQETRYSFTQYTAGGLFRWVDDKFRLRSKLTKAQRKRATARDKRRLKSGLFMYSTLDELRQLYTQ
ncbi:hypothetical protein VNI00_013435 [Paramarasmius palmivorus]|uniref:Uncharacterized protein n=1 Tax=Paramarasmius palmivorus TaxID=297713 RepID=A0AAW0C1I9_9AGAR